MRTYSHYGLDSFVLCLGYKGHVIKDFFLNFESRINDLEVRLDGSSVTKVLRRKDEPGWAVSLVETGEKAQTGARIYRIRDYVGKETFCVTYGDGLGNINIHELLAFHKRHGKIATVTGVRPPGRFGELELVDDRVVAFAEKPQVADKFINGGFFVFEHQFIERYLHDDDGLMLEQEPLKRAAADGELMMFAHPGFWQCMDTFREWKMLEEMWESGTAEWQVWRI